MYLLDTNVVSELRKVRSGRANRHVVEWANRIPAASLFLSSISILELETGVLLMERRDQSRGRCCELGSINRCYLHSPVVCLLSTPLSLSAAPVYRYRTGIRIGMPLLPRPRSFTA